MRSVSATLVTAQSASSRTPYIKMVFTSPFDASTVDLSTDSSTYGNRILGIDHHEQAFADFAYITLQDYDRTIPSLVGYYVEIGYGDTTGSGNEYTGTQTPTLWVMAQETVYASNKAIIILSLEGMWSLITRKIASLVDVSLYDPSVPAWGNYPASDGYPARYDFGAGASYYDMMEFIIEDIALLTLNALTVDDGIIDVADRKFLFVNTAEYHYDCQKLLYALISRTHCQLRAETSKAFTVVKPLPEDDADITFYNYQSPYFYEYSNKEAYEIPNCVVVFYNGENYWENKQFVTAYDADLESITAYGFSYHFIELPEETSATVAQSIADEALARFKTEIDYGYLVIPHDGRIQLYDKVAVVAS